MTKSHHLCPQPFGIGFHWRALESEAEAVLQRLEKVLFTVISPKSWKRYFEDKFVIINEVNLSTFHKLLSTALSGITFTLVSAVEKELPCLDVYVHKLRSETFETSLYKF